MLDIQFIRDNKQKVADAAKNKNKLINVDEILILDDRRRTLSTEAQTLREERNKNSKSKPTPELIQSGKQLKESLQKNEADLKGVEESLYDLMILVPNIPHDDVPVGRDEDENVEIRKWGEPKKFGFTPKDHVDLGESLGIIDIQSAGKVTGTRFAYLKGALAQLEYAIVMWVFSVLTNEKTLKEIADSVKPGYNPKAFVPVVPPVMIRPEVYTRMGRLDKTQEDERYYLAKDNQYLIGSAEHTLGPLHMDETLPESEFPIRYIGFSTAFRRESGSYGKDVRGILRVHQFDKLEIESFTVPEDSIDEQNFIVAIQEYLVRQLELPYQVIMICTGDMGAPDARQIDINTWMPGQNQYRETHTSDMMTDYQSRRLNTRVRRKDGSSEYVHMNDATAFAIGRILIAIMENYQQEDGTVNIPKVLQPLVGFTKIASK